MVQFMLVQWLLWCFTCEL